ncbi:phage integrase [Legionella tucsonensis]|uniref:Phage integrase n=1 Tax=Legionella tucsonensis TaxID=40335 RepID=A0A0W0ZPV2_9GAMM|nr:phage integrase [Legionella tucsonensis]
MIIFITLVYRHAKNGSRLFALGGYDLKSKTITLQDTKNHEIHTLPISDFVYELMERRSPNKTSEFVFPADSKTCYIYEAYMIERLRVQFDMRSTELNSSNISNPF